MSIDRITPTHTFTYDSATISVFHANKGQGLPQHSHIFSHATMCNAGSCIVRTESGGDHVIDKMSQPLNLSANKWHEIEALEDNTVFVNIFSEGKY